MRRLVLLLLLAAGVPLATAGGASAAVTKSNVTSPADGAFIRFAVTNNTRTISVAGQTDGTTGDAVDLYCTRGTGTSFHADAIATGVAVNADGTFTYNANSTAAKQEACVIRALPAGSPAPTSTTDLSTFSGPRVYLGELSDNRVAGGSNGGTLYDYYIFNAQTRGGMDYLSIGGCGLDDSFVFDPVTLSKSNPLFFCDSYLWWTNGDPAHATRAEAQIDGVNAYAPSPAYNSFISARDNPGFLGITYTPQFAPGTSDLTITESDPFLTCPGNPFPPTGANCTSYARAPVDVSRTIQMDQLGRQVRITDVYTSRDGHPHALDLLYEQDFTGANVAYRFPWRDTTFAQHTLGDTFPGPGGNSPGSIYVKGNLNAPDGDETDTQGAITYSSPPNDIQFLGYPTNPNQSWAPHYLRTVPGTGSLTLVFVYSDAFLASDVNSMAASAEASLAAAPGGTPPTGGSPPPTAHFSGVVLRARRFTVTHARVPVDIACPTNAAVSCAGTATLSGPAAGKASAARRKKKHVVLYGHASFSIRAGTHKTVTIKLTSAARKLLVRHHGKLNATLTLAARDGAGHRHNTTAHVTLLARKRH